MDTELRNILSMSDYNNSHKISKKEKKKKKKKKR